MIGSAGATSANTDVTDIWWNPNESGWGMQMVNTGTFVFATVYVYGADGKPTWLIGQLDKTGAALATFTGPLYVTTGPFFGGVFNPTAVTGRQAGTMQFVLTGVSTGQLTYSVDGVFVNKSVERQPLTLDNYSGNYTAVVTQTVTGCFNPAGNGSGTGRLRASITQNGQAFVAVTTEENGDVCTNSGTYSQLGRMGQATGSTSCQGGPPNPFKLTEMNKVPEAFTARFNDTDNSSGCITNGILVGVITR